MTVAESSGSAHYLGDDRVGAEFWRSGPHVFRTLPGSGSSRHVCALARFNRFARRVRTGGGPRGLLHHS